MDRDIIVDILAPNSGCRLADEIGGPAFMHLIDHIRGNPCLGCPHKKKFIEHQCDFYKARGVGKEAVIVNKPSSKAQGYTMCNADIGKMLGKTARQVSKLKSRGELKEAISWKEAKLGKRLDIH